MASRRAIFNLFYAMNVQVFLDNSHFFKEEVCTKYARPDHNEEDDDVLDWMLVEAVFNVREGKIPMIDGAYDEYEEDDCEK